MDLHHFRQHDYSGIFTLFALTELLKSPPAKINVWPCIYIYSKSPTEGKFYIPFNAAAGLSEVRITVSRVVHTPWTIILTKGLTLIKHNIIQDLAWAVQKIKSQKTILVLGCRTKPGNSLTHPQAKTRIVDFLVLLEFSQVGVYLNKLVRLKCNSTVLVGYLFCEELQKQGCSSSLITKRSSEFRSV